MGLSCEIGAECVFGLFRTDRLGEPTLTPLDAGGYLDVSPLDMGENIRREICLSLSEMGVIPESSGHASGAGRNIITYKRADPLKAADQFQTFKSVVKVIAMGSGLFASFSPKPAQDRPGNGLRLTISLSKSGEYLFEAPSAEESRGFAAGVSKIMPEITAFLNPAANSCELDKDGRGGLLSAVYDVSPGGEFVVSARSPDCAVNPYLAFALMLNAGLDGIESGAEFDGGADIPLEFGEALDLAQSGAFARKIVGSEALNAWIDQKRAKARDSLHQGDKW
jgi:glutamine synthetase